MNFTHSRSHRRWTRWRIRRGASLWIVAAAAGMLTGCVLLFGVVDGTGGIAISDPCGAVSKQCRLRVETIEDEPFAMVDESFEGELSLNRIMPKERTRYRSELVCGDERWEQTVIWGEGILLSERDICGTSASGRVAVVTETCGELYPLPVPDASGGVVLSNEVSYVLSPSGVGFEKVEIVSGESRLELESILYGGTGIRPRNGSAGPFDLVLLCADDSRTQISGTIVDTSQEPEPSSISTTLVPGASARGKREGTVPIFLVERGGCVELEVRVTREDGVVDEVTEHPGTVLRPLVGTLEQVTVTRPGTVCVDRGFWRPIFSIAVQHRELLQTVIVEVVDHDSE